MRLETEVKEWFDHGTKLPLDGRVHFVGIGGAGMSALARILLRQGREVSGSDSQESQTLSDLAAHGAKIFLTHSDRNVLGASAVIVSDAIELDSNSETRAAREHMIPCYRRSQLLAEILRGKRVIAVTGTHGKSTTTAILSAILIDAGYDPLCIVGADVPGFEGNVRYGDGEFAVVEACEAYNSFHDLKPESILLTNLEPDHLDYHKTFEKLKASVSKFLNSAIEPDSLVYCSEDSGAREVAGGMGTAYGFDVSNAFYSNGVLTSEFGQAKCNLIGKHNALNALGAIVIASQIGIPKAAALRSAANAAGCKRRLERIAEIDDITVIDDYAHHPTEVTASLSAIRDAFPGRRNIVVFQPHLYSRTADFLTEFAVALSPADIVVLTDIYPAREAPIPGISSARIAQFLENSSATTHYVPSRHMLPSVVEKIAVKGDVVIGMGAGSIESFAPDFVVELRRRSEPLKVSVFAGGASAEREVSLLSGYMVLEALTKRGFAVALVDPIDLIMGKKSVESLVGPARPDIVFLALHGTGAEDGRIQGLLETLQLPYIGSGVEQSALAMDKHRTKQLLAKAGIPVPEGHHVLTPDSVPPMAMPVVVKPNAQGSTIGLRIVHEKSALRDAVINALKYDETALVEEFIDGVEISVPVLGDVALPAVEIVPISGAYDYASKYVPGATEEIVPARISAEAERTAREYALAVHRLLGCEDFSRTDMIVQGDRVVVLEINTLPGLTATSLMPRSAHAAGIEYGELCERILRLALDRHGISKTS